MIKRTAAVSTWLVFGHIVLGALYWLLLQVPESNVLMLATSLLLVIAIVWWTGLVEGAALLASFDGTKVRGSMGPAARRAWMVILPLLSFALIWWLTGLMSDWYDRHGSEIDAWVILKTGWTKTNRLHTGVDDAIAFLRYGIGASIALTLFASLLRGGIAACASAKWIRQSLGLRQLALFVIVLVAGWLLPGYVVQWHWVPKNQIGTWVEPAIAAARLSLVFLWGNVLWAWAIGFVARRQSGDHP